MQNQQIISFDVGLARIGVARGSTLARIPEPLFDIVYKDDISLELDLQKIKNEHDPDIIIVGDPSPTSDNDSGSKFDRIRLKIMTFFRDKQIIEVDETFSTLEAIDYINTRKQDYSDNTIAAAIILQRYYNEKQTKRDMSKSE